METSRPQPKNPTNPIRWLIRRDMEEVLGIERLSFEHPWTEEEFVGFLRKRNSIGMVVDVGPKDQIEIRGYMLYELYEKRIHLVNMAVHPLDRGKGAGGAMVARLQSKLSSQRRTKITLEVRETNLDAQLFFQRHGFRATEVLSDYYDVSDEDAYRFEWRLPDDGATT